MQSTLLLNIVIRKRTSILKLFPSKDQPLLIGRNPLLVLNLTLDIVNRIRTLDFKRDRLPRQCFDEDLHPASQAKNEMESGLLLNVVVREGTSILELFARENETLLVGRNALLVLDFRFDVVDGVGWTRPQG